MTLKLSQLDAYAGVPTEDIPRELRDPQNELEFTLAFARRFGIKISPVGRPEEKTTDVEKITAWHEAGLELVLHGIRLRPGPWMH
jgi:hypothetical protein